MADRYWVGGTASWDATAGTKWATTSGGTGGASVPTTADDVFFTNLSTGTCTIATGNTGAKSINCTGFTGTIAGTANITVAGSITLNSTMGFTYSGTPTVTGTGTITSAGKTFGPITFSLTSGIFDLADALTSSGAITISAGTFNTNNFNVTATQLASNNSNVRAINLGSSTVTLSLNGQAIQFTTATNLTFNAGTSNILLTGDGPDIEGGGQTFNNVSFTGTLATSGATNLRYIDGANTFNNLSVTAPATAGVVELEFRNNQTINGTLSTNGTAGNERVWFRSGTYGVRRTLTVNSAPSLTDADFRDIIVDGTAAPISGTRIGNRGACVGITFDAPKTVYWNLGGVSPAWTDNGWASTSGGTPNIDNFPLPQDTAIVDNAGAATTIVLQNLAIGNFDMSARTTSVTIAINGGNTIYGSWTNGSGTSTSNNNNITFSGEGTKTITSAGKAFSCPITIDAYGGTVELADALSTGVRDLNITNGTFDTKNYNVTCGSFGSNNSNVRFIKLGSSTITSSGSVDFGSSSTNLTFDAGTSQINQTFPTAALSGGGVAFYNYSFTSTQTGIRTISGTNTFNNLSVTASATGLSELALSGSQTVNGTFTCAGSSVTQRAFVRSNTIGTTRTITSNAISANDCDFRDITIAGSAAGSSPTRAGDCGGNSGITFPSPKTVYRVSNAQNWSSTAWATSSGGTASDANFPLAQDTAVIDNGASAGSINTPAGYNTGTIDCSTRTNALTLAHSAGNFTVYGNYILSSSVTISGVPTVTFSGRGTQTFTSAGKTISFPITVDSFSGTFQLGDALTNTSAGCILNSGTFDAVSYNVTMVLFSGTGSTVRTLKMGSGLWTITGTGVCWNLGTITNLTFLKGTADILFTDTSTTARTFQGGALSYNKLTIGGATGTSTLTITQNNQFTELASTKTVAHTIALGSTTQTFGAWTVTGTAGNVVTLTGTGTSHVLAGSCTSGIDYLAMGSIGFAATSPAEFYAGANSTGTAAAPVYRTAKPADSTRYWVGGTGNWSDTARWSTSSGGASGASVPRSHDDVVFDSASNATAYTATVNAVTGGIRCKSLTISGPASGNVTLAGSTAIDGIHGNVTLPATGLTRTYTGAITLSGSTTGKTLTTNGVALNSNITVNGVGCEWTLGSSLAAGDVAVTNGSFNTGNYNVTAGQLGSNNTNSRTLILGSSSISLNRSIFSLDLRNNGNLSLDAGTSTITLTASTAPGIYSTLPITLYNVVVPSNTISLFQIVAPCTFNNLTVGAFTSVPFRTIELVFDIVINGTLTVSAGANANNRQFVRSQTLGTARTITCNAVASLQDIDFRDITIAGSAAPVSGTRLGDCKGNSGITFDAAKTVYWRLAGTNWGSNAWSLTIDGALDATAFPLAQDTAVFPASLYPGNGETVTINAGYNIGTIDMSLRTSNTMTLANGSTTPTIYGNWINGTGTTLSGTGTLTFAGRGSQTITSTGKTFTQPITIDNPSGTVQLADSITISNTVSLVRGTFDAVTYNYTASNFESNNSNIRAVNMGSGLWTITGNGNCWQIPVSTNMTLNKGTAGILLSNNTTSGKTFNGGSLSYNKLTLGGNTSIATYTIGSSNTFTELASTKTVAHTIDFGTTSQRVGAFTVTGTAGNVVSITGNTSNLIYTGGGLVGSGVDYLNVQGRVYGPNGETSGIWYAGPNSTNSGSLGWEFTAGGSVIYNVVITEAYTSAEEQDTAANIFNGAVTEDSVLADTFIATGVYGVSITENSTLADSSTPAAILYVSVTEPTTLANFQEFVNLITVSITEGSVAGDSQFSQNAFLVNISEGLTATSTQLSNAAFYAVALENSNSAATQAAQAAFTTLITEGFRPADIQAASSVIARSLTEGLTVAEAQQAANVFLASITEGVTSAETEAATKQLASAISENLTSNNTQAVQAVFAGRVSENVVSAEATNVSGIFGSSILEVLTSLSQENAGLTATAEVTDNIRVTDGRRIIVWTNDASQVIGWENNSFEPVEWGIFGPSAVLLRFVTSTENLTVADLSNRQAIFASSITEALNAASLQAARVDFNSIITENMLVSDKFIGYGWFRIVDDQTASWTNINNTQSVVWVNIGDDQDPNWVEINNQQP